MLVAGESSWAVLVCVGAWVRGCAGWRRGVGAGVLVSALGFGSVAGAVPSVAAPVPAASAAAAASVPAAPADFEGRAMKTARESIEAEAADKARREAETKARDRGDDDEAVHSKGEAAAAAAEPKPTAQRNFTDPDARIMKTADGSYHYCYNGYCYNGQAVVDADHQVIVATKLNNTRSISNSWPR